MAGFLALLAGLVFLAWIAVLREVLGTGPLAWLASASGITFVALWTASVAVATSVPATFKYSDAFELTEPEAARVLLVLGNHWLLSFAFTAAAPLVAAVSVIARRTGLFPTWLTWAGTVVATAVLLLTAPTFGLGIPLFFLSVLATSVYWLIRPPQPEMAASSRL